MLQVLIAWSHLQKQEYRWTTAQVDFPVVQGGSSHQLFWHQGPVSQQTIFPWTNGGSEMVSGWFKCLTFIVHVIAILMTPLIWQDVPVQGPEFGNPFREECAYAKNSFVYALDPYLSTSWFEDLHWLPNVRNFVSSAGNYWNGCYFPQGGCKGWDIQSVEHRVLYVMGAQSMQISFWKMLKVRTVVQPSGSLSLSTEGRSWGPLWLQTIRQSVMEQWKVPRNMGESRRGHHMSKERFKRICRGTQRSKCTSFPGQP